MKITTIMETTKQEKNIIYDALNVYIAYLTKMLSDSPEGTSKTLINTTLTNTNRLLSEMESSM